MVVFKFNPAETGLRKTLREYEAIALRYIWSVGDEGAGSGKTWLQEHHPQGIVWEYDPDKPFKMHSMATDFVELTYLGIPYRIPHMVDGKTTIRKAAP